MKVDLDLQSASVDVSSEVKAASLTSRNDWCDSADDWGSDDGECVSVVMETDYKSQQPFGNKNLDNKPSEYSIIQNGKERGFSDVTNDHEEEQNEKMGVLECFSHFQQMHIQEDSAKKSLGDSVESLPMKCQFTSPVTESAPREIAAEKKAMHSQGGCDDFENQVLSNRQRQFIPYFISTLAESLCVQQFEDRHVNQLLKDYERKEGCGYRESFHDSRYVC